MNQLFRPDACSINEAGISAGGNPLSRGLDAVTGDPLGVQQMREGYLAGPRPMGPRGPGGALLGPMMANHGSLEEAWAQEMGGMQPPMPMGSPPPLGATMQDQLRRHMEGPMGAELGAEAGFFDGPMQMAPRGQPSGEAWAHQFTSGGPAGPSQGFMRPRGADWADQFAAGPHMPPPGSAEMDAAFRQAQMGPRPEQMRPEQMGPRPAQVEHGPMGPMHMGPMHMGGMPMGPMMGPMMGQMPMGPMPMGSMPMGSMMAPTGPAVRPAAPPTDTGPVEATAPQTQMEEAWEEAQQAVQTATEEADLGQAAQMVEMLRNSGNPKFAQSQFVDFIDKVSKGDLQFRENTVIDRDGNQIDWEELYDTQAATASDVERQELENLWAASSGSEGATLERAAAERAWAAAAAAEPTFEDAWRMAGASGLGDFDMASMEEFWRASQDEGDAAMMEQFAPTRIAREYEFAEENTYTEIDDPLAEAHRLLREGRDREALLALEAEVRRNPESSEGWRLLGQLYADLDQDVEAIQCLRKGHEADPYNLDSLLALGVSCTNELDQLPALRYLRMWIENHEEHQALVQGLEPPPEHMYEAWRQQVTALFNQAAQANPLDANVFVALGVMENINRNYDAAVDALATACRLRPNDHTSWNKLGATLANSSRSEKAVVAYHQGLSLKPNYARSWSNLAIAHANLGNNSDAARFYLSSLVLNPQATHIWNFLHTAALNMNDMSATEAIAQRDLEKCATLIEGVLDPAALPTPAPELAEPPDRILASMGL